MNPKDIATDKVDSTSGENDFDKLLMNGFGYGTLFIGGLSAFPFALAFLAMGHYTQYTNEADRRSKPMPDSWLKDISSDETVSKEGLEFLASCLSRKGFVSIADAKEWLDIEAKVAAKQKANSNKEVLLHGEGAISLLNKVKEKTKLFDGISFDTAVQKVKDSVDVAKGLGVVTDGLKAVGKAKDFIENLKK